MQQWSNLRNFLMEIYLLLKVPSLQLSLQKILLIYHHLKMQRYFSEVLVLMQTIHKSNYFGISIMHLEKPRRKSFFLEFRLIMVLHWRPHRLQASQLFMVILIYLKIIFLMQCHLII